MSTAIPSFASPRPISSAICGSSSTISTRTAALSQTGRGGPAPLAANVDGMLAWGLAILGLGALLAGAAALVVGGLLLGPLLVWLAWNVLDLAHAVGAPELGFWGIV